MLGSMRAGFLVLLALALPRLGEAALAADTLRGIVTDSLATPLDGVYVTSDWATVRTKGDGTFQLALPTTTGIGPIASMGRETGVLWDPGRSAFSWPGLDGDVSIRVQDIRGRMAAQYSSPKGSAAGGFSLAELPQGNLIAAITVGNRTDAYRIVRLPGGESRLLGAVSRNSGSSPALLAKAAPSNALAFTKFGYLPGTATATGTGAVIKIKLASNGDPKAAYALAKIELEPEVTSLVDSKWKTGFSHVVYPTQNLDRVQIVAPGGSVQGAINAMAAGGGGVVILKAGTHSGGVSLRSKVTLTGEGRARTTLHGGLTAGGGQVTDVVIKDLTIDGRRGSGDGLFMNGSDGSRHSRIMLQNVNITNWGGMGVHVKRVNHIIMDNSNFHFNGITDGLYHNIYFLYNDNILQSDCDMSSPVLGKGNKYTSTNYVIAQRCVIRNCKGNGIQADNIGHHLLFHKYTVSGCGRVALWFPCEIYVDKYTYTENPMYAPQHVILNRCNIYDNTWGAMWRVVKDSYVLNNTFANKNIDMGLLKCELTMENNTFAKGNEIYTDVKQWPADVKILW